MIYSIKDFMTSAPYGLMWLVAGEAEPVLLTVGALGYLNVPVSPESRRSIHGRTAFKPLHSDRLEKTRTNMDVILPKCRLILHMNVPHYGSS